MSQGYGAAGAFRLLGGPFLPAFLLLEMIAKFISLIRKVYGWFSSRVFTIVLVYPGFLRTSLAVAVGPEGVLFPTRTFTPLPRLIITPRPVIAPSFLFWTVTVSPVASSSGPKWVLFPACPGVGLRERSRGPSRQ